MKRIVLILICLSSLVSKSQQLYIPSFSGASTITLNASTDTVVLYGTKLTNLDSFADFSDTLRVHFAVRDALGQPQPMDVVDLGYQVVFTQDTISLPDIEVDIINSYFLDGNNTVVIWPACPGILTYDSLEFVVTYASVNELIADEIDVTIGPNPASDKLFLGDPERIVKSVRFRNTEGKLIGTGSTNVMLDLNLSDGIYIIELETEQRIYTRKLIVRK